MIGLMMGALLAAQATAPAAVPVVGKWLYQDRSDPASGVRSASAFVRDNTGDRLIVKCDVVDKPMLSIQFIPQPRLPAGDARTVQLTLDSAKAEIGTWQFPGAGAFVSDLPTVFIYASEFAKAKEIQIGLTDDAGKAVGGSFAGPGDDALFRKVFEACGTPYEMPDPSAKTSG